MFYIGSKIYYDNNTGQAVWRTDQMQSENADWFRKTSFTEDYATYTELQKYSVDALGVIQLEFDQHAEDFARCSDYQVNLGTLTLEFNYPNPSGLDASQAILDADVTN